MGADGARLRVLTYGPEQAQPIVLAHGWAEAAEMWLPQIHALAGQFRLITFDQRGHGQSEGGDGPFHADLLGDDMSAVLRHALRAHERAVVVGHAMGGMGILSWASRYPQEVDRRANAVVLAATAARDVPLRLDLPVLGPGGLHRLGSAGELVIRAILYVGRRTIPINYSVVRRSWWARSMFGSVAFGSGARDIDVDFALRMFLSCPGQARGGWFNALTAVDVWAGISSLTVPTTVVAGGEDRWLPAAHSREIADELSRTGWLDRLVVLSGVGDLINLEATEQFNDLLRQASLGHRVSSV